MGCKKSHRIFECIIKIRLFEPGRSDGEDSRMMKMMSPSLSPDHQGRDITTLGLGLNYYFQNGGLSGHRLAAEWETPIDQKVNGVQLELDSVWTLGWQYAW